MAMDEARRFLRYVLPGLIVYPEIILIFSLNHNLENVQMYDDVGFAVAGFFASGIIGFIFSNLYYIIYWKIYLQCKWCSRLDYIDLFDTNKDLFKDHINNQPKSQREAWPILNVFFNLNYGDKLNYFEKKTDSISNILAAIGTTFVILLCCFIIGLVFLCSLKAKIIYSIINIIILIILYCNYQLAADILQNLYKRAFEWIENNPMDNEKINKNYG